MKKMAVFLLIIGAVAAVFIFSDKGEEVSHLKVSELAEQANAARFNRPSYELIPPTDLPPEGTRSLFDHLIAENGALPFPFERVMDMLAAYDKEGRKPINVMIPDGRSLLKGQANFNHPRLIVAADMRPPDSDATLSPLFRGRLFLGFVEDAAEIEVISWNEGAGRFEFQLVKDYKKGGVPRITYAKRAVCTTCHTGAAPIFPVRPWEETNGQPAIANKIIETRGAQPGDTYAGAPLKQPLSAPETVDELTDVANVLPVTQQLWIDGCGIDSVTGTDCRRRMFKQALSYLWNPGGYSQTSYEHKALKSLQSETWPKNGIAIPDSDLLNRNPFVDKPPRGSLLEQIKAKLSSDQVDEKKEGDDKLAEFEKLPPLRPELDPLTPREPKRILGPENDEVPFTLAQFFSAADRRKLEQASGGSVDVLLAAVDSDAIGSLLTPQPFSRVKMMQALLSEMQQSDAPVYCCLDTQGMSDPLVEGAPPLEIASGSVLETYEQYCFGCHRGNPRADLDFMNGETEEEVLARIKATTEIAEALDYERYLGTDKEGRLMPPKDSWQRAKLDEVRAEGGDDLQRMKEVIPSLFDF